MSQCKGPGFRKGRGGWGEAAAWCWLDSPCPQPRVLWVPGRPVDSSEVPEHPEPRAQRAAQAGTWAVTPHPSATPGVEAAQTGPSSRDRTGQCRQEGERGILCGRGNTVRALWEGVVKGGPCAPPGTPAGKGSPAPGPGAHCRPPGQPPPGGFAPHLRRSPGDQGSGCSPSRG